MHYSVGVSTTKPMSKPFISLASFSLGFSQFGTGQANFALGKHNGLYTAEPASFYSDLLDNVKKMHVILHDMDPGQRRAWHTNGERAILHMILQGQAMGKYHIQGDSVDLQAAQPLSPSSVRRAMLANVDIDVMHDTHLKDSKVFTITFKDLVREHYTRLGGFQATLVKAVSTGIEWGLDWGKHVQGYEYREVIEREPYMSI